MTTQKKTPAKKNGRRVTPPKKKTERTAETDALELLGLKRPATMEWPVLTDPGLADARDTAARAVEEAETALRRATARAKSRGDETVPAELIAGLDDAERALEAAKEAADAATVKMKLVALARSYHLQLLAEHPPTDEQVDELRQKLKDQGATNHKTARPEFNTDTYPPALLAEAIAFPPVTLEMVTDWWHGPECETCEDPDGGDDGGPAPTGVVDGDPCPDCHGSCRRPELSTWSDAELDGLFTAAVKVNQKIAV